jgi:AcrR family transcriptional regulator
MGQLSIKLPDFLFKRDPQLTPLGQRILKKGVDLMDSLGYEHFTFKKLAAEVQSTEPSIYRYFENKHKLLHYFAAWYWSWLDYRLDLATGNLSSAEEKLRVAIRVLVEEKKDDPVFYPVNGEALFRIIGSELEKTFLTKWVDKDYQAGYFNSISAITAKLSLIIQDANPTYEFPQSLASTILLEASMDPYLMQHVPSLSTPHQPIQPTQRQGQLRNFLESLAFGAPIAKRP